MTTPLDLPRAPRPGEGLDVERLGTYLRERAEGFAGDVTVEQFPSGHSNLTYLLRVGEREVVLRRPPFGTKAKKAHDMSREHAILAKLSAAFAKAPRPVLLCDDADVIGAPFYVMERVRGTIVRRTLPAGVEWTPERTRALSQALVDTLVELHAVDWRAAGLAGIAHPEGYVTRQVEGWTRRWHDAKTDEVPDVERAAAWLAANLPPETPATVVHNDFKLDNVVLDPTDPTRVVGVLDWEMSTVGDPVLDLGVMLGYWIDPGDSDELKMLAFAPTTTPGFLSRREIVARYADRAATGAFDPLFAYVFSLFKTAVVAQQIYARWKAGATTDPRFGSFLLAVRVLAASALGAIDRGTI